MKARGKERGIVAPLFQNDVNVEKRLAIAQMSSSHPIFFQSNEKLPRKRPLVRPSLMPTSHSSYSADCQTCLSAITQLQSAGRVGDTSVTHRTSILERKAPGVCNGQTCEMCKITSSEMVKLPLRLFALK